MWERVGEGASTKQIPAILIARHDLPGIQYDDMSIRQEIERGRRVGAGHQHQRPGLGHRGEAWGQRHRVAGLRPPAPDLQQRPLVPGDRIEARIGCHDQLGRQILGGEVTRHLARDVAF